MYMAEKLDAEILSLKSDPIEEDDHTGGLFDKLSMVGCELLKETLLLL